MSHELNNLNNMVPYSLGIVAVNKDPNSDIITVWPQQILPFTDGEIVDAMEEYQQTITDSFGRSSTIGVTTSNTIKAKWYTTDPNVLTAPDVRRGAQVQIWRMANTDYFYWSTVTNTNNYQKLEEKVVGFSNTQKEEVDHTRDPNSTWTQTVSTRRKIVDLIKTTKSDGEKWAYHIGLNVKEGWVNISDDIGNMIKLDSANNIIRLQTADGAFIEINKRDINIGCDNMATKADTSISEESTNKKGKYSQGWNTETPLHSQTGNYGIVGGISGTAASWGSGAVMQGDMRVTGDYISTSTGYTLNTHIHGETNNTRTTQPVG